MSGEKKILDFDKNELFVSSRIFEFILDNTLKTNLSHDMESNARRFVEKYGLYQRNRPNYPFEVFAELIDICRKANISKEQFYIIGNKNHELHALVYSSANQQAQKAIEWKDEMNLIKITLKLIDFNLEAKIEFDSIILIENKKIVIPLLSILKGFFERIYSYYFNTKPLVLENKDGLTITYLRSEVSNFDFVKFISNEQFVYSRIQEFIYQKEEEIIVDQISFFLFKDIGFSIEEIASKLNISVRSLQRKLKEESSNFRSIKEKVRRELSIKYLKDPSLSIHDVCVLLSYSERGAFEKAFKKWYGKNPSEYKKDLG